MVQSLTRERPAVRVAKGLQTRDRILDIAQAAVLEKGFAATSIDEILFEAGITKSGFFYHFRDKNDLALALIRRFQMEDRELHAALFDRADELTDDPLQAFLVGLKLMAETFRDLKTRNPGCLVATFVHQDAQFDAAVRAVSVEITLEWRARFLTRLEAIAERYPLRTDLELDTLADMLTAVVDGGIIIAKALRQPEILERQIMAYRTLVRAAFLGT
jgi:AcrR family transcriptional regulator